MKFNKITDKRPEALQDNHMPKSYDISLKAYGGGGTAKSLNPKPKKLKHQSMKGFEDQYKNIIDYIVRITYQIWEEKNIGYIYDTYSKDCRVWDEFGLMRVGDDCGYDSSAKACHLVLSLDLSQIPLNQSAMIHSMSLRLMLDDLVLDSPMTAQGSLSVHRMIGSHWSPTASTSKTRTRRLNKTTWSSPCTP